MYTPLALLPLLGTISLAGPMKTNLGERKESPAELIARDPNWIPGLPNIPGLPSPTWKQHSDDTCKVKTFYGPYTLKTPSVGFSQAEEYCAEKISDILVITSHGSGCAPLDSDQKKGGAEFDYIITKHITYSLSVSLWHQTIPGKHQQTDCATTVTVTQGLPGFPTDLPILPKPIPHLGWPGLHVPAHNP